MQITKIFDIILTIDNINILFSNNIESQIFNLIEQKYLNKCFLECFIIKINKIINRSLIESNQNDLNCSFSVCIQFEATCIIYNRNEVILNMRVKENVNNSIITEGNNIVAMIKNNKDTDFLKKGSIIPIIVGKAKFKTGSNKITINSYPFIPIHNDKIYYKINTISDADKIQLQENIINYIVNEENIQDNIIKTNKNIWNYFNDLLYPLKNNLSNESKKKNKHVDLLSFNFENSIVFFNDEINLSEHLLCIDNTQDSYIEDSSYNILYNLLKQYYLYIKLLNELCIQYKSEDDINSNKDIFNLYIKYKK